MDETIRLPESWKDWKIEELIGSGSYGDVYEVKYTGTDPSVSERIAAVKIIRIPSGNAEAAALAHEIPDPKDRERYYENVVEGLGAEISAMEKLQNNPNVVQLQDYCVDHREGTLSWTIYIRMERLTPFPEYMITHQLDEKEILRLGLSICNVLGSCEAHGIMHRDIKPENIMVSDEGMYKLGDFGVARQIDLTTGSLSLKGTFTYMAPEVYHGEKYDAKADQYSLGIVLYRLLNRNRDPFLDPGARMVYYKDRESALQKRMRGDPLPKPADASENTAKVILKACAFRKEDRYARFADLKEDLMICLGLKAGEVARQAEPGKPERRQDNGKAKSRPGRKFVLPAMIGAAAVVIIVLAVLGVFGGGGQDSNVQTAQASAGEAVADDAAEKIATDSSSEETVAENSSEEAVTDSSFEETETNDSSEESAKEEVNSGTCGENLTWEISGDTLTISGTGSMQQYNALGRSAPWTYRDFTKIVVEEGVTGISDYAFYGCMQVSSFSLPESLVSIGDYACDFWHLSTIFIPKNVNHIGTGFLTLSSDLTSIIVDEENKYYDSRENCNAIIETRTNTLINACENTIIPDTVTAIGPQAFTNCFSMKRIIVPKSVTYIDETAFESADELVMRGYAGSAAEEFANSHEGITFEELSDAETE